MKVVKKQNNSKMCLMCGVENPYGLKASFYELEDRRVACPFKFTDNYQSYPERTHGGMIACMCDEIAGRVLWVIDPNLVGVTTSLTMKYRKPVPLNTELIATGEIVSESRHGVKAIAKIYNAASKELLASADVDYLKMPLSVIAKSAKHEDINVFVPDDVTDIDI